MIKMRLNIMIAEHGINKSQLANATNIGLNTISRYCNNSFEKIDKEHLDKLCKHFQCELLDLIQYYNDELDYVVDEIENISVSENNSQSKYGDKPSESFWLNSYYKTHIKNEHLEQSHIDKQRMYR